MERCTGPASPGRTRGDRGRSRWRRTITWIGGRRRTRPRPARRRRRRAGAAGVRSARRRSTGGLLGFGTGSQENGVTAVQLCTGSGNGRHHGAGTGATGARVSATSRSSSASSVLASARGFPTRFPGTAKVDDVGSIDARGLVVRRRWPHRGRCRGGRPLAEVSGPGEGPVEEEDGVRVLGLVACVASGAATTAPAPKRANAVVPPAGAAGLAG